MTSKIVQLLSISLFVLSCSKSNDSEKKVENFNYCVPESALTQNAIVNGSTVSEADKESEDVVMLMTKAEGGQISVCTASAISSDVLVTAAHCVPELATDIVVSLHSSVSCESGFDSRSHIAKVTDVVAHPDYSTAYKSYLRASNDIALVFLEKKLPPKYKVHQIATSEESLNKELLFLGYGTTGYTKDGTMILRKTSLPSNSVKIDSKNNLVEVDQSAGTGICTGDSGGPALIETNSGKKVLSVNSLVLFDATTADQDKCGRKAVLTLIHPHLDWIESELATHQKILGF